MLERAEVTLIHMSAYGRVPSISISERFDAGQ